MVIKPSSGKSGGKPNTTVASKGNGHTGDAASSRDFKRLERLVEELDRRVSQNRRDLDLQFQRLADLQAVIDRMQMAATRARAQIEDSE
jgi:hypothetical protein